MARDRLEIPIDFDLSAAIASLGRLKGSINASVANAGAFEAAFAKTVRIIEAANRAQAGGATHIAMASGELVNVAQLQEYLLEQSQSLTGSYEKYQQAIQAGAATLNIQLITMREMNRRTREQLETQRAIEYSAQQTQQAATATANLPPPPPPQSSTSSAAPAPGGGGAATSIGSALRLSAIAAGGAVAFNRVRTAINQVGGTIRSVSGTLDRFNIARLADKANPALNLIKNLFDNFGGTVAKLIDYVNTRIDSMFTHWRESAHAGVGVFSEVNQALSRVFTTIVKHLNNVAERIRAGMNAKGSFIPGLEAAVKLQEQLFQKMFEVIDFYFKKIEARVAGSPFAGIVAGIGEALKIDDGGGLGRVAAIAEGMADSVGGATRQLGAMEAQLAGAAAVATGTFPQTSGVMSDYASAVQAAVEPARLLNRTLNVEQRLVHGLNGGLAFLRRGYNAIANPITSMRNRQQQLDTLLADTPRSYRRAALALDYLKMAFAALRTVLNIIITPIRLLVQMLLKLIEPMLSVARVLTSLPARLLGFGRAAGQAVVTSGELTAAAGNVSAGLLGVATASRRAERATTNIFLGGRNGLKSMVTQLLSSKLALGAMAAGALSWGASTAIATETATVKFGTLLGSLDQSKQLLSDITTFSAQTPFANDALRESAALLLNAKVPANAITDKLRELGDIAAGTSTPIEEIAGTYQRMAQMPKIGLGELGDLAKKGVPIFEELEKVTGVGRKALFKLIETGKVGMPEVNKAFAAMAGEGGKFAGGMAAQSRTFSGLMSTLKDNVAIALEQVGGVFVDASKGGIEAITGLVQGIAAGLATIRPALTALVVFWKAVFRTVYAATASAMSAVGNFITTTFGVATNDGQSWLDKFVEMSVTASVAATYFVENWDKGMTIVFVGGAYLLVRLGNIFSHFFLTTLPTLVSVGASLTFQLLRSLFGMLSTVFYTVASGIGSFIMALPAIIGSAVSMVVNFVMALPGMMVTIVSTLISLFGRLLSALPSILATAWSILTTVLSTLPRLFVSIVMTVVNIIGGLLAAVIQVIGGFLDGIGSGFMAILNLIPSAVGGMVTMLLNGLASLYGWFTETLPGLLKYFWDNWYHVFTKAAGWLIDTFISAITNIGDLFEGLWSWITGSGGEALAAVAEGVKNALAEGMSQINLIPPRDTGAMEDSLKDTLGDVSKGFGAGMTASIDEAMAKLAEKTGKVELAGAAGGVDQGLDSEDGATQATSKDKGLVAATLERDNAETLRAIFNAQQNRQADKALKAQERSAKASEEGVGYLRTLASRQAEPALEAF